MLRDFSRHKGWEDVDILHDLQDFHVMSWRGVRYLDPMEAGAHCAIEEELHAHTDTMSWRSR